MAITTKAVFNYTATAATTTAYTLTASTSIAIGDTLLLHLHYRGSNSASTSAVTDNAGNTWARVGAAFANTTFADVWFAPVTTVTSNFQIAVAPGFDKSVSARAATIIVLSGAHATTPIDLGSVKTLAAGASANTTVTLSTSLTTTADAGVLFVAATINNNTSVTMAAAAEWTAVTGTPVDATGGFPVSGKSFTRTIPSQAVYIFSASLAIATTSPSRLAVIYAVRAGADTGSASGAAAIVFGAAGTIAGTAAARTAAAALSFGATGTLVGSARSLSGQAAVAFNAAGSATSTAAAISAAAPLVFNATGTATGQSTTLSGVSAVQFGALGALQAAANDLTGAVPLVFNAAGDLQGTANDIDGSTGIVFGTAGDGTATGSATAVTTAAPVPGGWDPHSFQRFLRERRNGALQDARRLLRRAREASATISAAPNALLGDVRPMLSKSEAAREASLVAQRLLQIQVTSARQAWRLKEQEVQIVALQRRLAVVAQAVQAAEDEDDELLMMVA